MPDICAIIATRQGLLPSEVASVEEVLAHAGLILLREVMSAHCAEAQVKAMNTSLYTTEAAGELNGEAHRKAMRYNTALEVLDELTGNREEWWRIGLDQRR